MEDIRSQFDPNIRKEIKKKNKVAIIPVGSIEQHGPHLPVSTDSDIVTEVASRVAQKKKFFLLPTITYGVSFEHAPFFNLSIRESTLRAVLSDLCESLLSNGIKTVFIINGHHGNQKSIKNLDKKLGKISKNKIKAFTLSYWHFMKRDFDHAGFAETSLMLAISMNVRMDLAKKGLITEGLSKKEVDRLGRLATKSFPKVTKNGVWGDPTKASKKEGQRMLEEIVENISKKCQTCLTEDRP